MSISKDTKQLRCKCVLALIVIYCLTAPVQATETINLGNTHLLPNTPNQEIDIFVTNSRATTVYLQGLDFYVQVADGGPGAFGHVVGPSITGTIITPPEVFSSDNTGFRDVNPGNEFGKQLVLLGTTTDQSIGNGYIAQPGLATVLLGEIMVDTTGFFTGSWLLTMNTAGGGSDIITWGDVSDPNHPADPVGALLIDGSISVPEPASIVLGLFAAAGLAIVAIRKRRARPESS